jgi:hypothetical protein
LLFDEARDLTIGGRPPQRQQGKRERDTGNEAHRRDDEDERDAFLRDEKHREQTDHQHRGRGPRADHPGAQEGAPRPARPHAVEDVA